MIARKQELEKETEEINKEIQELEEDIDKCQYCKKKIVGNSGEWCIIHEQHTWRYSKKGRLEAELKGIVDTEKHYKDIIDEEIEFISKGDYIRHNTFNIYEETINWSHRQILDNLKKRLFGEEK